MDFSLYFSTVKSYLLSMMAVKPEGLLKERGGV